MSSFQTHALIGAVGGLTAFKIAEHVAPATLSLHITFAGSSHPIPPIVIGLGYLIASAYLALWPDIDEPGSYISRRASRFLWLLGAILGFILILPVTRSALLLIAAPIIGAVIGRIAGELILNALRAMAGGHRHLTHSLLVGLSLLILAGIAYFTGSHALAIPPLALAWGQVLHLAGDIVTPGGVPLFYPLSTRDIHILPYQVARFGELLIGCLAVIIGILAIRL